MAGPDVRQCRDCGKLFQYYGNAYCSDCLHKMDDYYVKVRDYIYEHPTADMAKVSEETEVDSKYINQFLREGRLQFANAQASGLRCSSCGKPIGGGTYCDECKGQMAQALKGTIPTKSDQSPQKNTGRTKPTKGMHIDVGKNR